MARFSRFFLLLAVALPILTWLLLTDEARAQQGGGTIIPGIPRQVPPPAQIPADSTSAASSPISDGEIIRQGSGKLVLVEGHEKDGSGFVCDFSGQKFLVTNAHVLAGNTGINFTRLDGAVVRVGAAGCAVAHDMIRLAVAPEAVAFSLLDRPDENLRVGDDVIVLGNAEGARVVTPINGHVVGLGPNLVEVDAPFLPGNSGSPIIHKRTGRVIGIATYVVREGEDAARERPGGSRKSSADGEENAPEERVRRFGYRLDSIKVWQPIAWPEFQAEAAEMKKITQRTDDYLSFIKALKQQRGQINSGMSDDPAIQRPLNNFIEAMKGRPSPTDVLAAKRRLLDDLRRASQSDLAALRPRLRYDYFQRDAEEKQRIRDALGKGFEGLMNSQANNTGR